MEKGQQVNDDKDRENLDTALDAFKWVTGQETEKHLIKTYPKQKVQDMTLNEKKSGKKNGTPIKRINTTW